MSNYKTDVTLIWAHNPMRHWGFLRQGMAGIDFGVTADLTGKPEDEVAAIVRQFDRSAQVGGQFKRLLFGTPIGSIIVSGSATGVSRRDRKWSVGRVVGGYEYQGSNPNDRHTIKVEWLERTYSEEEIGDLIGVNPGGRRSTVTPLGTVDNSTFEAEAIRG